MKLDVAASLQMDTCYQGAQKCDKNHPILMAEIEIQSVLALSTISRGPVKTSPGFTVVGPGSCGKRLELLKEAIPSVLRVNIIQTRENPNNPLEITTDAGLSSEVWTANQTNRDFGSK